MLSSNKRKTFGLIVFTSSLMFLASQLSTPSHAEENSVERFNLPTSLAVYTKYAFARSKYLIKPNAPVLMLITCSAAVSSRCDRYVEELAVIKQSGLTIAIEPDSTINAAIEVRVFNDQSDRTKYPFNFQPESGWFEARYDNGSCAVRQYLKDFEVKKVVLEVTESLGERRSKLCLWMELMRGVGLSFRERFEEYTADVDQLDLRLLERDIEFLARMIRMHLSPLTVAGMDKQDAIAKFR